MYIPWPNGHEEALIDEGDTSIDSWQKVKAEGKIPLFAAHFVGRELHRHGLSVGQPVNDADDHAERSNRRNDDDNVDAFCHNDNTHDVVPFYDNSTLANVQGVDFNVGKVQMERAKNHIDRLKATFKQDNESKYNLSDTEKARKFQDRNCIIPVAHHIEQEQQLQALQSSLVAEQRFVYNHIVEHVLDTTKGQLVSFITGEGGTGKSRIISALKLWSNVVFGKQEGDLGASVLCAPTGPAAFNIKGDTWQSVFGHSVERGNINTIEGVKNGASLRTKFKGVKIIIFDEISMIGSRALWEIHLRLQVASDDDCRCNQTFGGFHVLFFGVSTLCLSHSQHPAHHVDVCRIFINFHLPLTSV
jgi:hypothetical protein